MAAEFQRLSKLDFWKWSKDSENWSLMLADLEAKVIDTYVTALKESSDPETLTLIEVETTASKDFATTTETAIKAATRVVKTVSDKLDERAARDHRVSDRAQSQETLSGEHHSDPPNKVTVASDLKP